MEARSLETGLLILAAVAVLIHSYLTMLRPWFRMQHAAHAAQSQHRRSGPARVMPIHNTPGIRGPFEDIHNRG